MVSDLQKRVENLTQQAEGYSGNEKELGAIREIRAQLAAANIERERLARELSTSNIRIGRMVCQRDRMVDSGVPYSKLTDLANGDILTIKLERGWYMIFEEGRYGLAHNIDGRLTKEAGTLFTIREVEDGPAKYWGNDIYVVSYYLSKNGEEFRVNVGCGLTAQPQLPR